MRKELTETAAPRSLFRERHPGGSRLESLSDGVFALAIAILLISSHVPENFSELLAFVYDLVPFGICMLFIFWIWRSQVVFIRRYGLTEAPALYYHLTLLVLVLFYVYPLKFLMTWLVRYAFYLLGFLFVDRSYLRGIHDLGEVIQFADMPWLMIIYGLGFASIFLVFYQLYRHALARRDELELSAREVLDTRFALRHHRVMVLTGLLSAGIALLGYALRWELAGLFAGLTYNLIWVMVIVLGRQYRKRVEKLTVDGLTS